MWWELRSPAAVNVDTSLTRHTLTPFQHRFLCVFYTNTRPNIQTNVDLHPQAMNVCNTTKNVSWSQEMTCCCAAETFSSLRYKHTHTHIRHGLEFTRMNSSWWSTQLKWHGHSRQSVEPGTLVFWPGLQITSLPSLPLYFPSPALHITQLCPLYSLFIFF